MFLTVGELKKKLKDVPDDTLIELSSDTGVDQSLYGEVVVEDAYNSNGIFHIYCNYREEEE